MQDGSLWAAEEVGRDQSLVTVKKFRTYKKERNTCLGT
jgi:hypothetical protein